MKLAVQKDTGECVAVKIVTIDDKGQGGLTHECLRKEVVEAVLFFCISAWLAYKDNSAITSKQFHHHDMMQEGS